MLVSWNAIDGSVTDPDVSIAEDEDGGDEVMDASNVHIAVKEAVTAPRNTPDPSACVETEEPAIVTEHSGPDAEGSSVDPNPLESVIQEVPDLNSPPERISLLEPDFASPESSREITGAAPSVTLTKKVTFCESVPSDMAVAPSQRHGQLRPVRMALFFLIVVLVTSFTLYLTA
ncbi:hypothetical protein BC830DRAFT_811901 [Chytriomyces sp. MP71]|nr:hypothetical protein BC830DRAFT_811901 [Chytriomyces sp. MP71]